MTNVSSNLWYQWHQTVHVCHGCSPQNLKPSYPRLFLSIPRAICIPVTTSGPPNLLHIWKWKTPIWPKTIISQAARVYRACNLHTCSDRWPANLLHIWKWKTPIWPKTITSQAAPVYPACNPHASNHQWFTWPVTYLKMKNSNLA
jgi:hypothetical protein